MSIYIKMMNVDGHEVDRDDDHDDDDDISRS